jgi:hypothetical protein
MNNCALSGCHSGQDANSRKEGFVFSSYATITSKEFVKGDPDETELFDVITEDDPRKRMPKNRPALSQKDIGLIYRWIKMGAPNSNGCTITIGGGGTGGGTGSGCDSSRFTFSGTIQPMLNTYCKSCHTTGSGAKGVTLDNYNGVKAVAGDGRLIGVVKRLPGYTPMPQGGDKLSDCNIMLIEKWIASGALNN